MNRCCFGVVLIVAMCCGALRGHADSPTTNALAGAGITLAPYVQGLSAESVVVEWQTAQPAYGWVEYGETPALGNKADASVNGLKVANVAAHRVTLTGLRPGTACWYRVAFKPIRHFGGYHVDFEPEQHSEATNFHTLPGPNQPLKVVIFNDLHNQLGTFKGLCSALGDALFDFSIFNGDCLADPKAEPQVLASLAAFTQGARADSHPTFLLRGNHELRGAYARDLPQWLAWPGDKPYFGFTAGTVRFLVLDCGEDKSDDHAEYSGLVDFAAYRREETEWLKRELASRAFRKATWRVLIHHIPIYREGRGAFSPFGQDLWGAMLAKAHIDIALSAHTHVAAFHPAHTIGNPYPIAVGGGPRVDGATVMVLEAGARHLKLSMLNHQGRDVFPPFEKVR